MDAETVEVLLAGGAGGFCLALGRLLISYIGLNHMEDPKMGRFLAAQSIPIVVLSVLGMIVAWATAPPPVSPFLTGLGALGFILMLGKDYPSHSSEAAQQDV
ncbi:hypothetical protein [Arthrobacter sp. Y81]|uniref:hypothetical protein n=1 Tax=Arthrobacter sp. Y81 TaxID=2058897 RepID=UPI000CE2BC87|nr:hypothetical protein [Arthrobacter sp. Y81]